MKLMAVALAISQGDKFSVSPYQFSAAIAELSTSHMPRAPPVVPWQHRIHTLFKGQSLIVQLRSCNCNGAQKVHRVLQRE